MRFDLAHGLRVINALAAIGTFVIYQSRHNIVLISKISDQAPSNQFDFFVAASRVEIQFPHDILIYTFTFTNARVGAII